MCIITDMGIELEYQDVIASCGGNNYSMSLVGDDTTAALAALEGGIDACLEACYVPDRGDAYELIGQRLNCTVSPESLAVLVRRLYEADDEASYDLANGILVSLGVHKE